MNFTYSASYRNSKNVSVKTGESMITLKSSEGDSKNSYTFYKKWNKQRVDVSQFKTSKKLNVTLALPELICCKEKVEARSYVLTLQLVEKIEKVNTDTPSSNSYSNINDNPLYKLFTDVVILKDGANKTLIDILTKDLLSYYINVLSIPSSDASSNSNAVINNRLTSYVQGSQYKTFKYIFTQTDYEKLQKVRVYLLLINELLQYPKLDSSSKDNFDAEDFFKRINSKYYTELLNSLKDFLANDTDKKCIGIAKDLKNKCKAAKLNINLSSIPNKANALLPQAEIYVNKIFNFTLFPNYLTDSQLNRKAFNNNWNTWMLNKIDDTRLLKVLFRYFYTSAQRNNQNKITTSIPLPDWQLKQNCCKQINEFILNFDPSNEGKPIDVQKAWLTHKPNNSELVPALNLTNNEIKKFYKELISIYDEVYDENTSEFQKKPQVELNAYNTTFEPNSNYFTVKDLWDGELKDFPTPSQALWNELELQALKIKFTWKSWTKGPYTVDLYGKRNKSYFYNKYIDDLTFLTSNPDSEDTSNTSNITFKIVITNIPCFKTFEDPGTDFSYKTQINNTKDLWLQTSVETEEALYKVADYIVKSSSEDVEELYAKETIAALVSNILKELKTEASVPVITLRKNTSFGEAQSIKRILTDANVRCNILYENQGVSPVSNEDGNIFVTITDKYTSRAVLQAYLGRCNDMVRTLKKFVEGRVKCGYLYKDPKETPFEQIPEALKSKNISKKNEDTGKFEVENKPGEVTILILEPKANLTSKYYLIDDISNIVKQTTSE